MGMSSTATNVCRAQSLTKTVISVEERRFQPYVRDSLGYMNRCHVGQVVNHRNLELLGVPTGRYEFNECLE